MQVGTHEIRHKIHSSGKNVKKKHFDFRSQNFYEEHHTPPKNYLLLQNREVAKLLPVLSFPAGGEIYGTSLKEL